MSQTNTVTNCVACGGSIVHGVGREKEFCSIPCYRAGRSHCKHCGSSLTQSSHARKVFCNEECRRKYYRVKQGISPSPLDEVRRSTCKVCGNPIRQDIKGGRRLFCSQRCLQSFHIIEQRGGDITQEWGTYGTETRRVLREVQFHMGIGAAKRLATAIDREYVRRKREEKRVKYITYSCKTCGKEFTRRAYGYQSKEYCSDVCLPKQGWASGEKASTAKLTPELVEEIRRRYATESIPLNALGREYGVTRTQITRIVRYQSWNPEHIPAEEGKPLVKRLTWEQVDGIRGLYESGHILQSAIATKYGIAASTVWNIVNYKTYKPEHDPRAKKAVES